MSSPVAAIKSTVHQSGSQATLSFLRTPNTDSRFRPGIEEMHPSKIHRSTSKQIRSDFQPASKSVISQVTKAESEAADHRSTPTKLPGSWPASMTSSTFDFSITQENSKLSSEAQRIMNSVRGEAAKIKARMHAERAKQNHLDEDVSQFYGVEGRKIAQPKGKTGRYSDVHMQEFKKMDSIASHASVWKNKFQTETAFVPQSKPPADCEMIEPVKKLPRSKSFKATRSDDSDRLENTAPGKRSKKSYHEDTSAARPLSRGKESEITPATSLKVGSRFGLPSVFTTPTKASLARSASVKSMKTSMIPSLARSNSSKYMGSPLMPRTEGSKKYVSSLAKFGNLKSFLHRQPKFSSDPVKAAAGTRLATPAKIGIDKDLPNLPCAPQLGLERYPILDKRVELTPSASVKNDVTMASPSPSKIPALKMPRQTTTSKASDLVLYPSLASLPNITTRTKIPSSSAPGDFTFRSDKTIQFNPIPSAMKTPTIRQVRPSGITTPLPAFENLPPIPHGMFNKKRRRVDSDTEDEENVFSVDTMVPDDDDDDDEPKAKRMRSSPKKEASKETPNGRKGMRSTALSGGKEKSKKGVLTLSRLNMLAKPKNRR